MAALSVSAMLALAGCSAGGPAGSGDEGLVIDGEVIASQELFSEARDEASFVLYDSYPGEVWAKVLDEFTNDTGISVEHVYLISSQGFERLVSETGGGQSSADVIAMTDLTLIDELGERGLLADYDSEVATKEQRPDEGSPWYKTMDLVMTLTVNSEKVDQMPDSWDDLVTLPDGSFGVTPITAGGSSWSVWSFLRNEFGFEFWETLQKKKPGVYQTVSTLTQEIVRGERAAGITSFGTVVDQARRGAPIVPIFLARGTPAFSNNVALTAAAEHASAAKVYMNWLLSQRGAAVMTEVTGEFAARADAEPPQVEGLDIPSVGDANLVHPDLQQWNEQRDTWTREWEELFR